jgi:hypothetical protein
LRHSAARGRVWLQHAACYAGAYAANRDADANGNTDARAGAVSASGTDTVTRDSAHAFAASS